MSIANDILQAIGNTPIVQLRKVVPPNSAKIFVKLSGGRWSIATWRHCG